MISKITLASHEGTDVVLHEDGAASKRLCVKAQGLAGIGALRVSKRVKATAHGGINETSFEDGRSVHLDLEIISTVSIEDAIAEFRKVSGVLLETLDYGAALLKWTEGATGNKLQMTVKLDSEAEPIFSEAAAIVTWPVTLFATDPRAYSQTQTDTTGAELTGGNVEEEFVKAAKEKGIAVDSGHIYWAANKAIGRSTLAGGTIEPEWLKLTATPTDIVVNASNIFWASELGIGQATIAGASIENEWRKTSELTSGPGGKIVHSLAIDASHLYWHWTKASGGTTAGIGRATLAGATIEVEWIPGGSIGEGNYPAALVVDAAHIYWTQQTSIALATIAGAGIELGWISGASEPTGLYVSSEYIYWTNRASNAIGRFKLSAGVVEQAFFPGLAGVPLRLAGNSEHLYWNNETAGYVARSTLTGVTGSTVTVTNSGNRKTPLIFKIHGTCKNPSIVNKATGEVLALSTTVSSGNYLEVNASDRTVKLNGSANSFSSLRAAQSSWTALEAPTGSTEYQLSAFSATTATLEVVYRSAYA